MVLHVVDNESVPAYVPDEENPIVVFLDEGEDKTSEYYALQGAL